MVREALHDLAVGDPALAAMFTDALARRIRTVGRLGRWFQFAAGVAMVLMGLAVITGQMSVIAYWFLDTFPILAKIG